MSESRIEIMRRLRAQGVPDSDIAALASVTRQRIHKRLGPREKPVKLLPTPLPRLGLSTFPEALRRFRADHHLTQHEAAQWLGVSNSAWAHWEQGSDCPLYHLILFVIEHAK